MNRYLLPGWLLGIVLCATAHADWIYESPTAPSVSIFAADSGAGHLLAGMNGGGFWESLDGGGMWSPVQEQTGLTRNETVRDLQFYDAAGDTLLMEVSAAPFDTRRYLLTRNGGQQYENVTPGVLPYYTAYFTISHLHPNLWMGIGWDYPFAESHFLYSTNSGVSYLQTDMPCQIARALLEDPYRDSTLYSIGNSTEHNAAVIRSTDLGLTWAPMINLDSLFGAGDAAASALLPLSNGSLVLLLAPRFSELPRYLLSTDGGTTWIDSTSALPPHFYPSQIVEDRTAPGLLFMIGTGRPELLSSGDYGLHWGISSEELPLPDVPPIALSQDRFRQSIRLSIPGRGVWQTPNHGLNWFPAPIPLVGSPGTMFSQFGYAAYTTDADMFVMRFESDSWDPIHVPSTLDTILRFDPPIYTAGLTVIVPVHRRAASSDSETHQLAFSYDEGRTWLLRPELPFIPGTWKTLVTDTATYLLNFPSAPAMPFQMYLSEDLGLTWQTRELPGGYYFDGHAAVSSTTIFYAGMGELIGYYIFRSTDLGQSWQSLNWPGGGLYNSAALTPVGNDLLVTYMSTEAVPYDCWYWTAATDQWEARAMIPDTTVNLQVAVMYTGSTPVLAAAASGQRFWISGDSARSWQAYDEEIVFAAQGNRLTGLALDLSRQRLWLGTTMGPSYIPVSDVASVPDRPEPASAYSLSVYPNPFNATTRILYHVPLRGTVKLEMFDLTGRLVRVLLDEVQPAGDFMLPVSGDGLASGIYFLRLHAGSSRMTTKLVLLK
jgi:hypothetical protein